MPATRYTTIADYNTAHPSSPIPLDLHTRQALPTYHAAMAGLADDLYGTGTALTLEFLPQLSPAADAPDHGGPIQLGNVIATNWGRPPILVLAETVPLAEARKAILNHWPTSLTGVYTALSTVTEVNGTDRLLG
ncbi:hypothetical protein [Amycolatopsis palatopharyngis]|uniref:hypothetical protein n=1 Tax=Amycolatopsis palatopharyngis TaxID=187982 RepID=UPI000E284AEA|nr:hypothetical protein [Amycolatopsis palatopharyngis]